MLVRFAPQAAVVSQALELAMTIAVQVERVGGIRAEHGGLLGGSAGAWARGTGQ
jgi:hypothetical protein